MTTMKLEQLIYTIEGRIEVYSELYGTPLAIYKNGYMIAQADRFDGEILENMTVVNAIVKADSDWDYDEDKAVSIPYLYVTVGI